MTMKASETVSFLGAVDPVSLSAAALSTAYVPVAEFARILAVVHTGLIAATGVLNAKLEQATSAAGAGVKDITGKAITALADTADGKLILINCRMEELDVNGGFAYVRLTITASVAASLVAGQLWGFDARYQPKAHVAAVVEVVG